LRRVDIQMYADLFRLNRFLTLFNSWNN
jgi:hypothetical protein